MREVKKMDKPKIQPVKGLKLVMENGKTILKNKVGDVEISIMFAENEPVRNAKEACLSIISHQYCENRTRSELMA